MHRVPRQGKTTENPFARQAVRAWAWYGSVSVALTKDQAARELAEWHFNVEPDLTRVLRIIAPREDAPDEPIKLLEVNAATVATANVEPFAFAPSASTPFPTIIAEVTPEEFERIRRGELALPEGWSLETAMLFERPRAA